MTALVIVPTYNEAATICEVLRGALLEPRVEILVVDDSSPDGTADLVRALGDPRIEVLSRPSKLGLGPAYLAGFAHALAQGYDAVIEMDADMSHDPSDIGRLLDALREADVAIGSRYVPGGRTENWSSFRRFVSRAGNVYARTLLRLRVQDATSGFRAYSNAVLDSLPLSMVRSEGYAFQVEMTWRAHLAGFSIREVAIVFTERRAGASKFSRSIVFEALWAVARWAMSRQRPQGRHPRSVGR